MEIMEIFAWNGNMKLSQSSIWFSISINPKTQQNISKRRSLTTLGYKINGVFSGPRDNRRATFALLSDVPCLESADFRAANHAGLGQNVLFEDGHVEHLKQCNPLIGGDYLYVNQEGAMKAGLNPRDCVLAPGFISP